MNMEVTPKPKTSDFRLRPRLPVRNEVKTSEIINARLLEIIREYSHLNLYVHEDALYDNKHPLRTKILSHMPKETLARIKTAIAATKRR